jgi:hypothetical protein
VREMNDLNWPMIMGYVMMGLGYAALYFGMHAVTKTLREANEILALMEQELDRFCEPEDQQP